MFCLLLAVLCFVCYLTTTFEQPRVPIRGPRTESTIIIILDLYLEKNTGAAATPVCIPKTCCRRNEWGGLLQKAGAINSATVVFTLLYNRGEGRKGTPNLLIIWKWRE